MDHCCVSFRGSIPDIAVRQEDGVLRRIGLKITDREYDTLKSPDGNYRDFVYYHVCGVDGKSTKNTKKYRQYLNVNAAGIICSYAKKNPKGDAAKHICAEGNPNAANKCTYPGLEDKVVDSRIDLITGTRLPRHEEILIELGQKNPYVQVPKLIHSFSRQRASALMNEKGAIIEDMDSHPEWIDPTRTCEDCVFNRLIQTDSAMLRALAFSFTPFGQHVMTGDLLDRMKDISSFHTSLPISFNPLPTPSELALGDNHTLADIPTLLSMSTIRTEGRRQAAVDQETQFHHTLLELGPDVSEYFETGEAENEDWGLEDEYTPSKPEKRQKSTVLQAGHKEIQKATIQVIRSELEHARRYVNTPPVNILEDEDVTTEVGSCIRKVKRQSSSVFYSQTDILEMEHELERQMEAISEENSEADESTDCGVYQTCRSVLGETQWRDLLSVQLGLTLRQSIPGLDVESIRKVQVTYLTWLNHELSLSYEFLYETDPYSYWKYNRLSSNIIFKTLSTVAVCMLSTAAM
ncbi:hypothetical protein BLNAU_3241 [Blattamonas nauphoetae]|uniref:Uncharacterized protein n=1 Tax=Blattamonas nauphoetae TaxID=2049346 RepID=A0ABQ9YDY8_9EUKA|nr:hypothetical protein BLNAU_3241 [Blattamonas nauphoetae]